MGSRHLEEGGCKAVNIDERRGTVTSEVPSFAALYHRQSEDKPVRAVGRDFVGIHVGTRIVVRVITIPAPGTRPVSA